MYVFYIEGKNLHVKSYTMAATRKIYKLLFAIATRDDNIGFKEYSFNCFFY